MVERDLAGRDIGDRAVLEAFRHVPRELFAPGAGPEEAYGDHPLPAGFGQTVSQPYIIAFMMQALSLSSGDRVLEIGTGSGYQTILIARVADFVYGVERLAPLARMARERLKNLGVENFRVRVGDGAGGWPENAPYDAVIVSAACPAVPAPLLEQLAPGGRLVAPVGGRWEQELVFYRKTGRRLERKFLVGCRFVPLIGPAGWGEEEKTT